MVDISKEQIVRSMKTTIRWCLHLAKGTSTSQAGNGGHSFGRRKRAMT